METPSNDSLRNRRSKKLLFFWLLLGSNLVLAQRNVDEPKLLITNHTLLGWSQVEFLDTYLSGIRYRGNAFQLSNIGRRIWSPHTQNWFLRSDFDARFGLAKNIPATASMTYAAANLGLGFQYQVKVVEHVKLLVGSTWDADFGMRYSSRDVNNYLNVDLSTNLNLVASLRYDFRLNAYPLKLLVDLKTPVVGLMCVPERGASYYEIFTFEGVDDLMEVSSLHSKNGLNAQVLLQIPMRNLQLDVGFQYEYLRYESNNVYVGRNGLNLQLGLSYDFSLFGGRKNKAVSNMLGTEW